jgi:glycerol dehydratase small subunit/propanediol dehydratase small subunit
MTFKRDDYPLAEKHPDSIKGQRGNRLNDITLDAVLSGEVTMEDLRITPEALMAQAEIARAVGRPTLARNFERAAELVGVPQDAVMEIYELLRPGRAKSKRQLLDVAEGLRNTYKAEQIARFIEEAAEMYDTRGLFKFRF